MSRLAANSAAQLYLSLRMVERANQSLPRCNGGGEMLSSVRVRADSNAAAIAMSYLCQEADENFALPCACRYVSRLLLGHCFGAYLAPGGSASFCFGCAAFRVMVPP